MAIPVYAESGSGVWEGEAGGERKISIERFDGEVDRMFFKFRLVDVASGKAIGEQRFVERVELASAAPALAWPKSIKGVSCPVDVADLRELGVRHTHINLDAAALVRADGAARNQEFSRVVEGRRGWLNGE